MVEGDANTFDPRNFSCPCSDNYDRLVLSSISYFIN